MTKPLVSPGELLERGAYAEAAEAFFRYGEYASAARAFVCASAFERAAKCYELAAKPLDAARLHMLMKNWKRASQLYAQAGDSVRAQLALQQIRSSEGSAEAGPGTPPEAAFQTESAPEPRAGTFPEGKIWRAMQAGDFGTAAEIALSDTKAGTWPLLDVAGGSTTVLKALGETLVHARDFAVAAEAFRRAGEILRSAECLSEAGLNEEASDLFMRSGQPAVAAQHLEKAHAWEQAASIYHHQQMYLDASRCHERADEPAKAAALYLKAKRTDLALPLLQAIPPKHRQFVQCRLLAAKIFFQKNERTLALNFLAPLMDRDIQGDVALETFYQIAVLLEQAGEAEKARQLYSRLQEARFGFKDVDVKLQRLSQSPRPRPAPGRPSVPSGGQPERRLAPRPATEPEPVAEGDSREMDLGPLRDCSLLNRLDLDQLRRLWACGAVVDLSPGEVLHPAGQNPDSLYVILSGGLTITADPADPAKAVGFLGRGDYVGLTCLVQGPPRTNALVSQGSARLLRLPGKDLEMLASTEPELGARLFRSIADQLSQALIARRKI